MDRIFFLFLYPLDKIGRRRDWKDRSVNDDEGEGKYIFLVGVGETAWRIWLASCLWLGNRASREQNVKIRSGGILIPRVELRNTSAIFFFFLRPPSLPSHCYYLRIFRRHKSRYYVARETNHYTADGLLRRKFDGSTVRKPDDNLHTLFQTFPPFL